MFTSEMRASRRISRVLSHVALAIAAGAAGACVSEVAFRPLSAQAQTKQALRVSGIELINGAGSRAGFFGMDERDRPVLRLFDQAGQERLELLVDRDGAARANFYDGKGNELIALGLAEGGYPELTMSEADFGGRIQLGRVRLHATDPNAKGEHWVLRFEGNRGAFATLGMNTGAAGAMILRSQTGERWQAPLKRAK